MITHDNFLTAIEGFLAKTGISPTRLGREAVGDPNFVIDLRGGRVPNLRTAGKVLDWMSSHTPAEAETVA